MQETEKIWMNGELVDWADARIHVGAHGLHYGTGVFEGIRCYATERGPAVFRLDRPPRAARDLREAALHGARRTRSRSCTAACIETIAVNGLEESYLRPIAFFGYGELGVHTGENPVDVVIMCFPWGAYLGEEGQQPGDPRDDLVLAPGRPEHDPARGEGDRRLPELDARHARGAPRAATTRRSCSPRTATIADGPGETIFVVKDGTRLHARPVPRRSCPGITRDSIIQIAQDLGYTVVEKPLIRTDLYTADEVFMAGTAVEITPVRSVDDHEIGVGPVTLELQKAYTDTVTGRSERWAQWLDYADARRRAPS